MAEIKINIPDKTEIGVKTIHVDGVKISKVTGIEISLPAYGPAVIKVTRWLTPFPPEMVTPPGRTPVEIRMAKDIVFEELTYHGSLEIQGEVNLIGSSSTSLDQKWPGSKMFTTHSGGVE